MTNRYVGAGGNDANSGLNWANRKLTLNGVEDTPVAAGDTVYIGPGIYRETLTLDVSGSAGSPITYIGDYSGANTDGVGGVVRITGSNNDQTAARANCITQGAARIYRSFTGIAFDYTSDSQVTSNGKANTTNWTFSQCYFGQSNTGQKCLFMSTTSDTSWTVLNCVFCAGVGNYGIYAGPDVAASNTALSITNSIFFGCFYGIYIGGYGGVTISNCTVVNNTNGIRSTTALTAGQTITVNNCIVSGNSAGLRTVNLGELVEDYNAVFGNATDRQNVGTGANSKAYGPLFDPRWFFQLVTAGAGPNSSAQVITPFDLSSYSQIINVAGTSPTTTDMRGTAVQGTQREFGALEYDSTLKLKGGGGAVSISPSCGGGL